MNKAMDSHGASSHGRMLRPVDLHVHSNRSDGTFSPTQLVDYAMEKGLAAFALTDHDTVDGLEEAITYAENLKRHFQPEAKELTCHHENTDSNLKSCVTADIPNVPEVIPGIEFSTEYQGQDIHILGLYIDWHSAPFRRQLQNFVDSRITRNRKMCSLLQEHGIPVHYEKLLEEFPHAVIIRAHYAKYMLNHGYIKNMKEAFERYIDDHGPCFVPREKVTPEQAVALILEAGGIPILAHPILYHMSDERLDALTATLKNAGLEGIEAIYSTYSTSEERQVRNLAAKYSLCVSGGSDFHGANKPGLDLAVGYGKLYIPYAVLHELKKSHFQTFPSCP